VNIADVVIPTAAPSLPWGVIGACVVVAMIGLALWKTTVGKIILISMAVFVLTGLYFKAKGH